RRAARFYWASDFLENNIEQHGRNYLLRIAFEHNWAHQLAAGNQRVTGKILIGVAFENGITGEVKLCSQWLVAGCGYQVMHVLADAVGIVSGQNALESVIAFRVRLHGRSEVVS